MLGNILYVGAEGTVQGVNVGAFLAAEQNDAVDAGTFRKCLFCSKKVSISAVIHQSSVISSGMKVSDPVLEVGDGRCDGDIPLPPGVQLHARTRIPRVVPFL